MDIAAGKERSVLVIMLKIDSLTIAYGKHLAVKDAHLKVYPGEVVALIGPNGAGKSSLIKGISGVNRIRSGSIRFADQDIITLNPVQRARIMAVVSQVQNLGGAFTVEQTVMLGRTAHMNWLGKASREDLGQIEAAMENTNILALKSRKLAELSGGEQQRVFLARALAQTTPLLLLDEPTNHLDLHHQVSFLSLMRRLVIEKNLAALLAMHDLNLVSLYADRLVLIVGGEIVAEGTPKKVLTESLISKAYNFPVKVIQHSETGNPLILPSITQG